MAFTPVEEVISIGSSPFKFFTIGSAPFNNNYYTNFSALN
jgi:hypothetical protein